MAGIIKDNTLYRFRSINNLLGDYKELEKQSIFFAPPEMLNDPMEGFRDICFTGDVVLWRNLFKHYLLCFFYHSFSYFCTGIDESKKMGIEVLKIEEDIPDELRALWDSILDSFFNDMEVDKSIGNIVKYRKNISKAELSYYLSVIHPNAIRCVFTHLNSAGLINIEYDFDKTVILNEDFFEAFASFVEDHGDKDVDLFFSMHQSLSQQTFLILEYNNGRSDPNRKIIYGGFPSLYVKEIEKLIFPNWSTACFMSDAINSSVWGHYGSNHTGICLMFNSEVDKSGNHNLTLSNATTGIGVDGRLITGDVTLQFYDVRYTGKQDSLNFFESLGRLPIPIFNKHWLRDKNGNRSEYAVAFDNKWRERYWKNFYVPITQKSKDWEYENEHRLILNDMFGSDDKSGSVLNYDFKSLKGMIFGINTSDEVKLKVIKIIENKVRLNNHYEFKFYQAYYCRHTGEIQHTELNILNFKKPVEDVI